MAAVNIELIECSSLPGLEQFHRLAEQLYASDPLWAPLSEGYFDRMCQTFMTSGQPWLQPVVAMLGGEPQARAAAIFHPQARNEQGRPEGYIGFFECLPGFPGAGAAVLERCENLLCTRGVGAVQAPRADNLLLGLLVDGFHLPQTIFTPHNPPNYRSILEGQGYRLREKLVTYQFTRQSVRLPPLNLPGIRTRTFDRVRLEEEARLQNELQREIFLPHGGYVPRSLAEDRRLIESMLPLLDDDLLIIAEDLSGRPVGLLLCLPDAYQASRGQPVDTARLISIGVLPDWRYRGCGAVMVSRLAQTLVDKGYRTLEASWIKSENRLPQNLARRFGGVPGREFALFMKEL